MSQDKKALVPNKTRLQAHQLLYIQGKRCNYATSQSQLQIQQQADEAETTTTTTDTTASMAIATTTTSIANATNTVDLWVPRGGKDQEGADDEEVMALPATTSFGRYDEFVRWLNQEALFKKILLSTLFSQSALLRPISPGQYQIRTQRINYGLMDFRLATQEWLPRFSSHVSIDRELREGLKFYGSAIPLGNPRVIRRVADIDDFFKGITFFTEKLWPLIFYALLTHDVICYSAYPNNRYGAKAWQIFVGWPSNQQTWTTYLNEFYGLPALLVAVPIVLGLNRILQNCHKVKLQELFNEFRYYHASIKNDALQWLNPLYSFKYILMQTATTLSWDRFKSFKENEQDRPKNLLRYAIDLANASKKITQLNALKILAQFVDALDRRNLNQLRRFSVEAGQLHLLQTGRDDALAALREHSKYHAEERGSIAPLIRSFYANYLLWSIGYSERRSLEPLFWLYESGIMYAKYRLYASLFQFIYQKSNLLTEWHFCHEQHKVFPYMWQSAKRECTVCGDWSYMYYPDVFEAQSCVDGALKTEQSPNEILFILKRVRPFGISSIDFSSQNWTSWDQEALQKILQAVNKTSRGNLTRLDMSCRANNSQPLNVTNAQVLATFISSTRIQSINFNNQNFSPEVVQVLAGSMANNSFVAISLAGNNLGVEGSKAFGTALTTLPTVSELDLSQTNTTDETMQNLAVGFRRLSLQRLILQGNNFGESGIQALAASVEAVGTLDISGNNFQNVSLSVLVSCRLTNLICAGANIGDREFIPLANNLPNSTVVSLDVSNNRLTAIAGQVLGRVLPETVLQELSLNGNGIGDKGIAGLSAGLVNSSVTTLQLSQIGMTNTGLTLFSTYLPQTEIIRLDLSGNHFSSASIGDLSSALSDSCVQTLDISENYLTDYGIKPLVIVLEQANCTLVKINLSANLLTPKGAEIITNSLRNNTSLKGLILSSNRIEDGGFTDIALVLSKTQISQLECSDCEITEAGADALAGNITATKIKILVLDNNKLGDKVGWRIAQALIQPIPNSQDLGDSHIGRDFTRAVHNAQNTTEMTMLSLANCELENYDARSFCRILPSTSMRPEEIDLSGNAIDPNQVDLESCWISPGTRTEPPFFTTVQAATKYVAKFNAETESFFKTAFELISEIGIEQQLIPCLTAFALAFRQEALEIFIKDFSAESQKEILSHISAIENLVLTNFVEMGLRIKYHGAPTIVHDITMVSKKAYQETVKKDDSNNYVLVSKVAMGAGVIAGIYGISWAITTVIGSPVAATLALPIIFNGKKIIAEAQKGYKRYGLFGGVCSALEAAAYSVPGGHLIEQALTKQSLAIEAASKKPSKPWMWKKGFLLKKETQQTSHAVEEIHAENKMN